LKRLEADPMLLTAEKAMAAAEASQQALLRQWSPGRSSTDQYAATWHARNVQLTAALVP
jgi:hypothetical protein